MKQISEFLGYNHSDEMIDKITEHSTFASMKKNPMTNPDSLFPKEARKDYDKNEQVSFMRKGRSLVQTVILKDAWSDSSEWKF